MKPQFNFKTDREHLEAVASSGALLVAVTADGLFFCQKCLMEEMDIIARNSDPSPDEEPDPQWQVIGWQHGEDGDQCAQCYATLSDDCWPDCQGLDMPRVRRNGQAQ